MENKYSKTQFDGYTHRFIVELKVSDDWRENVSINIYSNSGSRDELLTFINKKKSEKVIGFKITHIATKEQDELASKFIDETFKSI